MATASKAFRARAFDSNRSMTVYWGHELPDLSECSVGNRAVTQMPSGMEKDEEMESHLQDAILAQQASTSGVQVNHVIPTPKVSQVDVDRYNSTYHNRNKLQRTKYIKVHAWQALERDEPDYDYDTEDEAWLADHTHIEPRVLEKVFDTVESHSSETQIASEDCVISLHKSLDTSTVYEIYEYWLSKRTSAATTSGCIGVGGLTPRVRTECRKDGQGAVNPYVAFRRRAEKMQTRKNRKNDEDSYEKILKLVHDMSKARQLFDMTARREKQKVALIDMESEILAKRMEMADFGPSSVYNEFAEKLREKPTPTPFTEINGVQKEEKAQKRNKKIRRRPISDKDLVSKAWLKKNAESWNRPPSLFGQNVPSGVPVATKPIRESMADGKYAFKRRRGCSYRAALTVYPLPAAAPSTSTASAPPAAPTPAPIPAPPPPAAAPSTSSSSSRQDGLAKGQAFYETFVPDTSTGTLRSIGFARRRMGRGGRVLFDRMPRGHPKPSTDPWADYCVADSSRTFRARLSSLGTEEETEEPSRKSQYFSRSDRVNFNDDEVEREWASRYQKWTDQDDEEEEERKKFDGDDVEEKEEVVENHNQTDDSEIERMEVDDHEDEKEEEIPNKLDAILNGKNRNGSGGGLMVKVEDKNEEEEDMDVDEHPKEVVRMNGGGDPSPPPTTKLLLKPLQEHSPPLSGNGRADRAEPTPPVPAKMCGTVSDSDEWREPSGSPSESNSSTEWAAYTREAAFKTKLIDDEEMEEEHEQHRRPPTRDHSIKDSMSTVTLLERKKYMMPSTIGM